MGAKKIVFLDIDGVICLYPDHQQCWVGNENNRLDGAAVIRLKEILDMAPAKIVLTSSWRLHGDHINDLFKQLARYGLTAAEYFEGFTPDLSGTAAADCHNHLRWLEISEYIAKNKPEKHVILDDFDLSKFAKSHMMLCKRNIGLTDKLKTACIEKLNK